MLLTAEETRRLMLLEGKRWLILIHKELETAGVLTLPSTEDLEGPGNPASRNSRTTSEFLRLPR